MNTCASILFTYLTLILPQIHVHVLCDMYVHTLRFHVHACVVDHVTCANVQYFITTGDQFQTLAMRAHVCTCIHHL